MRHFDPEVKEGKKGVERRRPASLGSTARPGQPWRWDITYLRAPVRGEHFYPYLFLDVWSRKIVGWRVHDCEDNKLAAKALVEIREPEGVDPKGLVVHSNTGGPMKGATMVATLESLGSLARSRGRAWATTTRSSNRRSGP